MKRANETMKRAANFLGAAVNHPHRMQSHLLTGIGTTLLKVESLVSSSSAGYCRCRQALAMRREIPPRNPEPSVMLGCLGT